jgi:hypothetical protein
MTRFRIFIPSLIGVMIMLFSYYMESTLESNFESDRYLASKISTLLEHQKMESKTEELINVSVNSLLESNHSLLLRSLDFIWATGFAFMLWLFPYHAVLRSSNKKI